MGKTIKYGMLGCGMMGHEHLRNLALIDGAQVVAIAEPDALNGVFNGFLQGGVRRSHSGTSE